MKKLFIAALVFALGGTNILHAQKFARPERNSEHFNQSEQTLYEE